MNAVSVESVRKTFGATIALDGVSFRVPQGSVYGVLGPNGAGKSTLLRSLLGLIRPDSGTISVLGQSPGRKEALLRIGALIERPAFLPALTARQNLLVLAAAKRLPDEEVERTLAVVGLVDRRNEAFSGYSLGMGQRLGVAAALLGSPQLLVLDEPTSGLDPEGVLAIRQLLLDKAKAGTTIIVSSQILSEVEKVCDRVIVLRSGKVLAEGVLTDVLADQKRPTATIKAGPGPAAQAFLVGRGLVSPDAPIPVDLTWSLAIGPDEFPLFVKELVLSGVTLYRAEPPSATLEDAFLSMVLDDDVKP